MSEQYPYQTILVTGGAGFIGSTYVAQAVARGHTVIVLDALTYAGHKENLECTPQQPGSWQLVQGDICDGPLVAKLLEEHKVDAIINFAAESHVDNSIASPASFIQTNIQGVYTLLEAARAYWKNLSKEEQKTFRFIQVSTDEVYGSLELDGDDKFTETTPMAPSSPYSASKAAGDHLALAWFHTYKLPTIVTNCTNNYGPRQYPEKLIPHMIMCALSGKPLPVYGDGKNVRDWIHVEDHAHGVDLALNKGKPGETYCFGGKSERNNLQVVGAICEALEAQSPAQGKEYKSLITFVPDRPGHDRRYAIDDSKAEQELGFTRKYKQFEDGLEATVKWYLDNQAWCTAVTNNKEAA